MKLRPNRVQKDVCREAVASALGPEAADDIMRATGVAALPTLLPAVPRDLGALAQELQPFVDLYRALLQRMDREAALAVIRRAIVDSGLVSHAADAAARAEADPSEPEPLNVTSPPPPGFQASPAELAARFRLAMAHFSCAGELLAYTPEFVRFRITECNWCKVMEQAGTPELIPFFCETDERFMEGHPTHRLRRPTTIGLGDSRCDFQFVPFERKRDDQG